MIIDNKEISEEFIKQLITKMGKEQEQENLTVVKEKLLSIKIPNIDLMYAENLMNCLEYDVFDCFNIAGIRYIDLEEMKENGIQLTDDIISKDKDRIVNFLINVREIARRFKECKIQQAKPINIDVKEVRELLC